MPNYADRYGIPAHEVDNLSSKFKKQNLKEGFGTFDKFVRFCAASGYKHGMLMRRYDPEEPHGPDNTYFIQREETDYSKKERERKCSAQIRKNVSAEKKPRYNREGICAGCKKECRASGWGCSEYQRKFVENWNTNIHRKKPEPPVDLNKPMIFRYEHPDLIREGIVFVGGAK